MLLLFHDKDILSHLVFALIRSCRPHCFSVVFRLIPLVSSNASANFASVTLYSVIMPEVKTLFDKVFGTIMSN